PDPLTVMAGSVAADVCARTGPVNDANNKGGAARHTTLLRRPGLACFFKHITISQLWEHGHISHRASWRHKHACLHGLLQQSLRQADMCYSTCGLAPVLLIAGHKKGGAA